MNKGRWGNRRREDEADPNAPNPQSSEGMMMTTTRTTRMRTMIDDADDDG